MSARLQSALVAIDDRCRRSVDTVSASSRAAFQMIALVAEFLDERGLRDESARLLNLLENDLLPSRLIPNPGTKAHRRLLAEIGGAA